MSSACVLRPPPNSAGDSALIALVSSAMRQSTASKPCSGSCVQSPDPVVVVEVLAGVVVVELDVVGMVVEVVVVVSVVEVVDEVDGVVVLDVVEVVDGLELVVVEVVVVVVWTVDVVVDVVLDVVVDVVVLLVVVVGRAVVEVVDDVVVVGAAVLLVVVVGTITVVDVVVVGITTVVLDVVVVGRVVGTTIVVDDVVVGGAAEVVVVELVVVVVGSEVVLDVVVVTGHATQQGMLGSCWIVGARHDGGAGGHRSGRLAIREQVLPAGLERSRDRHGRAGLDHVHRRSRHGVRLGRRGQHALRLDGDRAAGDEVLSRDRHAVDDQLPGDVDAGAGLDVDGAPERPVPCAFTGSGTLIAPPAKNVTSPPMPSAPAAIVAIGFETVRLSPASKSSSPPLPPEAALMSACPVTVMLPVSDVRS